MRKWLIVILSLAWLAWELIAVYDGSPETWPLTKVIVTYVPESITLAVVSALTIWIAPHFVAGYRKREEKTMTGPIPVPPTQEADARNRSARTFLQGLLVDVAIALVLTVGPLLVGNDFTWSANYWRTLGLLAAKTIITAIVSYFARRLVPPQFDQERHARPIREVTP